MQCQKIAEADGVGGKRRIWVAGSAIYADSEVLKNPSVVKM